MAILIGILAALGFLGLYSRLQDIEVLKERVKTLEEEVQRLKKEAGLGNQTGEKMESL